MSNKFYQNIIVAWYTNNGK